jgi:hypothetical protein
MTNENFESLDLDEVLGFLENFRGNRVNPTCTVKEFMEALRNNFRGSFGNHQALILEARGMPCRAWRFGKRSWQNGRIRFILEFCPDDSDEQEEEDLEDFLLSEVVEASPLDSIRQLSNDQDSRNQE